MGTLYLIATPIGNLEDISLRALRLLGEVNLVAAEDTRHTQRLLKRHALNPRLVSYHEHNKTARLPELLEALQAGDVALVSDAGTPGLSDPGYELVKAAWDAGHSVSPIPGPSAPLAALVASGLPTDRFHFVGYLPRRPAERRELIESLSRLPWTLVAFETPHRLLAALKDLEAVLGSDRPAVVARELTKQHESFVRGGLGQIRAHFEQHPPLGEITLVIQGLRDAASWSEESVRQAVAEALGAGQSASQAARQVARLSGWPRQAVYRIAVEVS